MRKTTYQSALVSAGEPRDDNRLPIRYELPCPCDPHEQGHHFGIFTVSEDGSLDTLVAKKRVSKTTPQGFDEVNFQPVAEQPFCLVYATGEDVLSTIVAIFRFTTRPAT
jgi:hypothetical protein